MNFCIVVARYNEDLEWTKLLSNVIIYNKGTPLTNDEVGVLNVQRCNQILLNNVGREGHTYYKHIYDNYDNLTDYIFFLQGYPFDHSPNIIPDINKYINNTDLSIDFVSLSEHIIDCNLQGCIYQAGLPLINIYEKLFDERKEHMDFKFGAGAQFMVSKKKILQRPKDFYLKIVKMLENDINPIEGFVIERFHNLIFK
jgi:hypothetical protein